MSPFKARKDGLPSPLGFVGYLSGSTTGDFMLRTAFVMAPFMVSVGIATAPAGLADPPYRNCSEAHADGRYNIPSTDSAYRPQLDRDGDGFACEPYKGK